MTTTPTPEEMTVQLHKALDAAVGLTADDISNVQSLMDVGERLVAFEMLGTQAYEGGVCSNLTSFVTWRGSASCLVHAVS